MHIILVMTMRCCEQRLIHTVNRLPVFTVCSEDPGQAGEEADMAEQPAEAQLMIEVTKCDW